MLYNTGNYQLAAAKELSPVERTRKAKLYYDECITNANGFYQFYEYGMKVGNFRGAAFQLHQAAENYYKTIELVFTDYKPKTHDLGD